MARTLRRKAKRQSDRTRFSTRSADSTSHRISSPRSRAIAGVLVIAALGLVSGQVQASAEKAAETEVVTAAIAIDEPGGPAWRARALERAFILDLKDIPGLDVVSLEAGEARLVLRGTLEGERLVYSIDWPARAPAPALIRGSISLRDTDRAQVVRELRRALDSAVADSRVLAASASLSSAQPGGQAAVLASPPDPTVILTIAIAVAVFLALPLGVGVLAVRASAAQRLTALTSFWVNPIVWLGIAAAAYTLIQSGDEISPGSWPISVVGGLAWGWLAALVLPGIFPTMGGLHRIEHGDLLRIAGAWLIASLERAAKIALFNLPFALALWLIYRALELDDYVAVVLAIPVCGLVARLWYLALVDSLSLWLDSRLVDRSASESRDAKRRARRGEGSGEGSDDDDDNEGSEAREDPWTEAARAYFMGYVRRAGWPADDSLLGNVEILPGHGDQIVSYGGGLTHSRMVVGVELLKMALAPCGRPHDYAAPRVSRLHWDEWNAGLVVPVGMYVTVPSKAQRQPRHTTVPGETERVPLGQPPTLAAYVEPDPLDLRDNHRPSDDPMWLDWDPGEEHDGTDPSDKDFLFGAMVRELGVIKRGDQHAHAAALAMAQWLGPRASLARMRRILGWIAAPYKLVFARSRAIIEDGFATLNFAHNHLVQYLAWRFWQRDDVLTARAYAPEMEDQSDEIFFNVLGWEPSGSESDPGDRDLRDRLLWLSEHGAKPMHTRRGLLVRRLALAGIALAGLIAVGAAVKRASDYHPTYLERIQEIESQNPASDSDVTK